MGKIEEAVNPADLLDDPEKLKEAGNDFFKKSQWDSALDCYSQVCTLQVSQEYSLYPAGHQQDPGGLWEAEGHLFQE